MMAAMMKIASLSSLLLALGLGLTPPAVAQQGSQAAPRTEAAPESEAAAPLSLKALEITPADPAVDTLCHLTVRIENTGSQPASSLLFSVSVGGRPLPVYANQIFMQPLPPGEVTAVRLYNFWTTETDRPAPAGGKLPVEVTLEEARWLEISRDDEGVEIWQPLAPVPGLPVTTAVNLQLATQKGS